MSIKSVFEFMQKTASDGALRQQLATLLGVGDGDIRSLQELDATEAETIKGERGVLVANFAGQQGYEFTIADLNRVIDTFQRLKAGELSAAQFNVLLGLEDTSEAVTSISAVENAIEMAYRGSHYEKIQTAGSGAQQVLQFMEKTATDDTLRQQLQTVLGVGDGDISDVGELDLYEFQALKSERGALVAEFAAKQGFEFTMADLSSVADALRLVQNGQLSEQEFAKALRLSETTGGKLPTIAKIVELSYKGIHYTKSIPAVGKDSILQVVRFMEKSASDDSLRQQLQIIIGGDGDVSSPGTLDAAEAQALKGKRGGQVAQVAAQRGFNFSVADLSAVVGAFQLVQSGQLSEAGCVRILGLSASKYADAGKLPSLNSTVNMVYRGIGY